jgi:secretion/DNA translocation related CpaE-like protein
MRDSAQRPLFVTDDAGLLDVLARAAAAAGVVPDVVREAPAAVGRWATSTAVLIGADQLGELNRLSLPRRGQVYVVAFGPGSDGVFREALACGAESVLDVSGDADSVVDLLTDTADGGTATATVVGVVGGAGGVGASTFAAALAIEVGARREVLLVDADRGGPGADLVLGIGTGEGVRWDALAQVSGRLSARSLRESLPRHRGTSVLTWSRDRPDPLALPALRAALAAGVRGFGVVVVDIPRAPGPVTEDLLSRCDQVVVVSTLTVQGLTSCAQVARRVPADRSGVLLRGRGGIADAEVERVLRRPVWHRMPDQSRLDEAIGLGLGPLRARRGPLARAARRIAGVLDLGAHPEQAGR